MSIGSIYFQIAISRKRIKRLRHFFPNMSPRKRIRHRYCTLVEKSSKPAAPINYHWRFQLPRASKKKTGGPGLRTASGNLFPLAVLLTQPSLAVGVTEPPVETYFHWRFS
jgi:hypothetical protein